MDALILARLQFAFVISFHVLFPAFTVGLASWLAFVEFRWLRTHNPIWRDIYFFWMKIFAVSFGMGVVSGIVMSFQLGTNWSVLSVSAGGILGPLLGYEVLTAFFLEASFLGVMLFGWGRVPQGVHFLATVMVALGTLFSTFWILSANSWLHTPQGFELRDGLFLPKDWWAIVFNPSFPYRLVHMTLAAFITTCFVIGGVGAWYLRRREHVEAGLRMWRLAIVFACIAVPAQVVVGDLHGLNTLEHQPIKVAAMEGHWEADPEREGQPLVLFGWPDAETERNRYALEIPRAGSLILTHTWDEQTQGLKTVPADERPPVAAVFWAFRIMIGIGVLMLLLALASLWRLWRGGLESARGLQRAWTWMLPAGFIAMLAGWHVTELGRQPYVIYGWLRTADAVSATSALNVAISLTIYVLAYAVVFGFGMTYMVKMVRRGPLPFEPAPHVEDGERTPARPISAADRTLEP